MLYFETYRVVLYILILGLFCTQAEATAELVSAVDEDDLAAVQASLAKGADVYARTVFTRFPNALQHSPVVVEAPLLIFL